MPYPLTIQELQEAIARETARMSYPGGMSRGVKQVVIKGAKQNIEEYFATVFPMGDLWNTVGQIASSTQDYDKYSSKINAVF